MDDLLVNFRFGVDLVKADEGTVHGERQRIVEGLASLETPDQQGETVVQKGMNFKPFLSSGNINWDHGAVRRGNPDFLIGVPTDASIVSHKGVDAFFIKGYLYNDPVLKPIADSAWRHMLAVQHAKDPRQRVGFSIEGTTVLKHNGRILKSTIMAVALTPHPVHQDTAAFAQVMKSLSLVGDHPEVFAGIDHDLTVAAIIKAAETAGLSSSTVDGLAPLRKEDLERPKRTKSGLAAAVKAIWGEEGGCGKGCYSADMRFTGGAAGAVRHLTGCQGWPLEHAEQFVRTIKAAW